jgi:predicted GNAT family acetyltransferase
MEGLTITRHDSGANGEYRAHVPGSEAVGRLTWYLEDGVKVADHTLVPPAIGNRGVAAKLVEALVADAQVEGFKVRPLCSYVVVAFKRHPEWAGVRA